MSDEKTSSPFEQGTVEKVFDKMSRGIRVNGRKDIVEENDLRNVKTFSHHRHSGSDGTRSYLGGRIHSSGEREARFLTPRETDSSFTAEGEIAIRKQLEILFETTCSHSVFETLRFERKSEQACIRSADTISTHFVRRSRIGTHTLSRTVSDSSHVCCAA